jgi:hypothetical protein
MAAALSDAVGRPVRHRQYTPLDRIGNPDMQAMWRFLNGARVPGRQPSYALRLPICTSRGRGAARPNAAATGSPHKEPRKSEILALAG